MKFLPFLLLLSASLSWAQLEEKQYTRINLMTEINLLNLNWNDLSLAGEESFLTPLMDSWKKWFQANLPTNVKEIQLCQNECLKGYDRWQEQSQDESFQVSQELLGSLWLRVSLNLRRVAFISSLNEWSFEWDGRAVLIDANTKRVIATEELHIERRTWRGLSQKALNSALAGQLYRSSLSAFSSFSKKIQNTPQLNRLSRLVILGHKNLDEVMKVMELLREEGKGLNIDLKLDSFSQKEAQIICFYQGEEKSFSDLLSRLKELKLTQSYRLVNEFTGIHHVLKLVSE